MITPRPAWWAARNISEAERSNKFQVACTEEKSSWPSTLISNAFSITSACLGPLTESPMARPLARSRASSASTAWFSRTPLSRVAE